MTSEIALVSYSIENQIHLVRGQKVLLDSDLAALYEVEVRALIQAVKRNEKRFPRISSFSSRRKRTRL
jgi:broad specificity phosphatase PhoE